MCPLLYLQHRGPSENAGLSEPSSLKNLQLVESWNKREAGGANVTRGQTRSCEPELGKDAPQINFFKNSTVVTNLNIISDMFVKSHDGGTPGFSHGQYGIHILYR